MFPAENLLDQMTQEILWGHASVTGRGRIVKGRGRFQSNEKTTASFSEYIPDLPFGHRVILIPEFSERTGRLGRGSIPVEASPALIRSQALVTYNTYPAANYLSDCGRLTSTWQRRRDRKIGAVTLQMYCRPAFRLRFVELLARRTSSKRASKSSAARRRFSAP